MKICIYGGQYGSEGKGAVSEWYARRRRPGSFLVVAGENAPNSGHTCSIGKTRNLPVASFYADVVILGPDSVINPGVLMEDMGCIAIHRGKPVEVLIHENAAILKDGLDQPNEIEVTRRVSSTGSGSGWARVAKQFHREDNRTIGTAATIAAHSGQDLFGNYPVRILNRFQYLSQVRQLQSKDWIFECSQGVLLDTSWGIYPYVTSRSTIPACALARNGLNNFEWTMVGVYRTYPIRTGGPSGPTAGEETTFQELGVPDEVATVTKRTRRIFQFHQDDFYLSYMVAKPDIIAITHLDYLKWKKTGWSAGKWKEEVLAWMDNKGIFDTITGSVEQAIIASEGAGNFMVVKEQG